MTNASEDDDRPAALDPRLQAHLGRKLREFYDEITAQPVPDRFRALLDQLENRERSISTPESDDPARMDPDSDVPGYGARAGATNGGTRADDASARPARDPQRGASERGNALGGGLTTGDSATELGR